MAEGLGIYEGIVVCTMDARRSQVYNAVFKAEKGKITRICEDRAIALEELKEELLSMEGPLYLVGDGSVLTYNTLQAEISNLILPPEYKLHQRAVGVGLLANAMAQKGEPGDANALSPNYLRLSQAERERLAREQK